MSVRAALNPQHIQLAPGSGAYLTGAALTAGPGGIVIS